MSRGVKTLQLDIQTLPSLEDTDLFALAEQVGVVLGDSPTRDVVLARLRRLAR